MLQTITVNGHILDWQQEMTVGDVLKKMNYSFRLLIIHVNGDLVKRENWDCASVPAGADVSVYHLISGG